MTKNNELIQKAVAIALLIAIACGSFFWVSGKVSSPEFHADSIEALNDKRLEVMSLTAATAAGSMALAAIPGDATTPIANEIADLTSYLMVVAGAIMVEKLLLTLSGYIAFTYLIPCACILMIIHIVVSSVALRNLSLKLAIFGIAICLVVPASLKVSTMIENTDYIDQAIESVEDMEASVEGSSASDGAAIKGPNSDMAASSSSPGLKNWLSNLGSNVTNSVSNATQDAKDMLNSFIDAIAVLIITTCVIPMGVLVFFLWLIKAIFGLTINLPKEGFGRFRKRSQSVLTRRKAE